ncbi:hypothetical protein ACWGHD_04430 [Streptomyces xanthophaeus]
MAASAQSGHSIIDEPATAESCARDYAAAKEDAAARKSDSAGAVADLRGRKPSMPHRR